MKKIYLNNQTSIDLDNLVETRLHGFKIDPNKIKHTYNLLKDNSIKPSKIYEVDVDYSKISSSQQRIINALRWAYTLRISPADKTQIALLADASPTSGGYFNNLGALRTAGLINYPSPGMLELTPEGMAKSDAGHIPTTNEELHDQLFQKLSYSQVAILKTLIQIYPEPITKQELAERTNTSPTSGGYFNNLGKLRSLKLIDYPSTGMVKAQSVLFIL